MTATYMLEIDNDELAVLWAALLIVDREPGPKPTTQTEQDIDNAAKSVLSKVERLMVGK